MAQVGRCACDTERGGVVLVVRQSHFTYIHHYGMKFLFVFCILSCV